MIDYDIYNERRQQLIDTFEEDIFDLIDILKIDVVSIVDNFDWEDNEHLADQMGWTLEDDES